MRSRLRIVLAVALPVLAAVGARAQPADLTRATCAGLNELRRNERADVLLWLHGYYAGAAQRSVLDRDEIAAVIEAVQAACERKPAMALIGGDARALFLGEPPLPEPPAIAAAPSPAPAGEPQRPAAPSPASARPTPVR